ncbi:hypothetical protein ACFVWN_01010 [Nocardiopsis flavescens]|uniref:hypothetical protein n=1 Tax=Nocardiopsis flavescens TaxID=758803 RepID=UPI00364AB718
MTHQRPPSGVDATLAGINATLDDVQTSWDAMHSHPADMPPNEDTWTPFGNVAGGGVAALAPAGTPAPSQLSEASSTPWYSFGALAGVPATAEVAVLLDDVVHEAGPTDVGDRLTSSSWTATVAGYAEQLRALGLLDEQLRTSPILAAPLELRLPCGTYPVRVQHVEVGHTTAAGTVLYATVHGEGPPPAGARLGAPQLRPDTYPEHLVPAGHRIIGGAKAIMGDIGDGDFWLGAHLDTIRHMRRELADRAPYAPTVAFTLHTPGTDPTLVVLAIEEVLSGSFTATLIDGPAAGRTLRLERPVRVIRVPQPQKFIHLVDNPLGVDPGAVDYRPVPGRPYWYSVNGGALT